MHSPLYRIAAALLWLPAAALAPVPVPAQPASPNAEAHSDVWRPLPTPYDLYEAGPWTDERLAALEALPGRWQALHQERVDGRTWILLALPDGAPADAV
ncbi:hypothetical protein K8I85_08155, partial [bacterium]|nr:hypothetical protein [bacterium]